MTTRRGFLKGATATAALAGLPAIIRRAGAAEPVTVATGFGFLPNFIEMMNAYSGGHFARAGLDAKVIGTKGTAQTLQLLVAGQVQFARAAALDLMNAVTRQAVPLLAIATICQHSAFQLVSLKERPIAGAEELKGKTVGIVSLGGTTDMFLDLILAKAGLQKEEARREPVGDNPGAVEFVRRGRIDCFICSLNTVVAIERSGVDIQYWSTDRYAPMPGQVYQTTKDIAAAKPELVRAYLRAMKASVDELVNEPIAPIFRRATKDFDIAGLADMDGAVAVQKATEDQLWLSEGKPNLLRNLPPLFAAGVETLRQGGIADIQDPTSLYTNRFIDEVLKG